MADPASRADVTGNLYALTVYLHASSNRDLLDGIAREQLSFSQLLLLERLRGGRIHPTMRQAAVLMHVSPAGASRIVDGLARRGMIRREGDEHDYRAKRIIITERGEAAIASMHAARLEQIEAFTEELEPEERKQLQSALTRVLRRKQIAAFRPIVPA